MRSDYNSVRFELDDVMEMASRGLELAEGVPMYDGCKVLANYVMPVVGFWMVEHEVDAISKEEFIQLWEMRVAEVEPEWYWDLYDSAKRRDILPILKELGVEKTLELLTEKMEVLSATSENVYQFTKTAYRIYFAAQDICGKLKYVAEVAEDAKEMEDEDMKMEIIEYVVEELAFFEKKMWPKPVLRMCAEHFQIPSTLPHQRLVGWFQEGGMGLRKEMNLFRRVPENPVMEMILSQRALEGEGKAFYAEKNLVEMLRQGREGKNYVDFTGIDFHGIDLTGIDLCEVVFFHKRRGEIWAANLQGTGVETYFANKNE